MTDEFDVPLGREPKKKRRRFAVPKFVPYAVAVVLAAAVAGFVGWAVVVDDPLGGEPMVVAAVDRSASNDPKAGRDGAASPANPTGE